MGFHAVGHGVLESGYCWNISSFSKITLCKNISVDNPLVYARIILLQQNISTD